MALRSTHVFLGLGASCVIVAVAYLPPKGLPSRYEPPWYWVPVWELRASLEQEFEALSLLERRDHGLPRLAEEPSGAWLFVDPALPSNLDSAIRAVVGRDAPPFERRDSTVRIAAAVFLDTVTQREGFRLNPTRQAPRLRYIITPSRTDGTTCLTISTVGSDIRDAWLDPDPDRPPGVPYSTETLFGPCHYLRAFGAPSPSVEEWILAGAFQPSSPLQARCLKGETVACRFLLFRPESVRHTGGIAGTFGVLGGERGSLPRFNSLDRAFFTHVIDSVGVDRFARFWTGSDDVETNFQRHIGKPIDVAVREWLESRRPNVDRETTVVSLPVALQVLLTVGIGLVLAGAVVANRRAMAG